MVRGRERESAQLHEVVAAARTGRVEVLVLAGEAGIGKTTLLDTAAHATEGMQVLRTTGMPTETQIGFVGLVDLLTPVLEHRTRLPASQRRAIERALALGRSSSWPAGDGRLTLRVATLALLAAAADEAATLVVVDDAQWVDQESLDTLAFAARRLAVDRIGFLFAVRMPAGAPPEAGPPVPGLAGFPVLRLAGLDYETSDALLTAAAPQLTERVVRDAVLATAAGNPLALQEIPRLLGPDALASAVLARPLPVGNTIRQTVGKTLAELGDRTRAALVVAAASQEPRWTDVSAALEELGLSLHDLEPADEAGLIHLGGEPGFRHPLVQAAIYHEAPAASRRKSHRALAAAAAGHQAAEMRAGHLAAAATGPDPAVAVALAEAGRVARDRGAWQTAMIVFRRAAQFTTDPELRTAHLLAAAQAALLAASPAALDLATAAAATRDPLARAHAHRILGTLWNAGGDARRAAQLFMADAARIDRLDGEFGVRLRLDATASALHCGDYELADSAARDAVERAEAIGGELLLAARISVGWVRFCRAEADPEEPFGVPLAEVTARIPDGPGVLPFAALALPWLEYYDQAREVLDRIQYDYDGNISPDQLSFSHTVHADLAFRTGRWAAGIATATESARLAGDLGHHNIQARALTLLAQFEAAMGRSADCERHVAEATEIAQSAGLLSVEIFGAAALGLLAVGARDHETAVAQFDFVRASLESSGVRHPGIICWAADLIEALHRTGAADAAEQLLAEYERRVARTRYRTGEIGVARCRIILGHADERLEPTIEKLGYGSPVPAPFEQARLLLAYGEHLRLSGRRAEARRPLRDAGMVFARLGATPWADRATAELRAAGGRGVPSVGSPVDQLSPQELQVARHVARGARNREVATALFLSPKTVEGHLSNIYRKLGIRSRAELVARMAGIDNGQTMR
ncbi:AAA family ATPase [Micromonospora sp. NBC_01638]|uniref:AAA family ATPase n=1 Tax=Micromonospora sp. NBC_01638 TaxID=2975982 RepID=UPI00386A88CA|nr:AAA family ATPase [Micromonospora sp. NBC_01638]